MWISPSTGLRGSASLPLALLIVGAAGFSGCANPGPPKPPSLNLPAPVKDLRAERIGKEVHLAWTTPTDTTDDLAIRSSISAEICRDDVSAPASAVCAVVGRLPVKSGPSAAADLLPASLLVDPVRTLRYRVRILNASAHTAGASNSAFAAGGTAPGSVSGLRSSSSPEGTRILWLAENAPAASVTLQRSTTSVVATAVNPAKTTSSRAKTPVPEIIQLQASLAGADHGGAVDVSGQRGAVYRYVAWRTRSVVLGGKTLTLRSPDSAPLLVTIRDTTPPATPAGLEAIVDAGFVDLSWEPDTDSDLAGYWIERSDPPASEALSASEPAASTSLTWVRRNPSPVLAPAFRDTPPPGAHRYLYRVLAVDNTGNLSPPTPPVATDIRREIAP